jgi:hypothetical protein
MRLGNSGSLMPEVKRRVGSIQSVLVVISLMLGTLDAATNRVPRFKAGNWSKDAIDLSIVAGEKRSLVLQDPTGRRAVKINDMELETEIPGGAEARFQLYWSAELDWASDGNAFFVTQSDAGPLGTWSVKSYFFDTDRVLEISISALAVQQFVKSNACRDARSMIPNAMGVTWVDGSKDVVLVVRVPFDVHTCAGNSIAGYRVNARSGEVEEEFTFAELQRKWGRLLGRGFHDVRG